MRRVTDLPEDIYDRRSLEHERELLLALWELSDQKKICFIAIDLEGPTQVITELGLAFQRKHDSQREGRHIIVKSTQQLKKNPPKTCGFGFSSEEVDKSEELYTILDDFFEHQRCENSRVVLTGFDIKRDLFKLNAHCGWRPPTYATLLDAATIFRSFSGRNHPKQAAALAALGFERDPTAPFHNAANDAWYALELLFRKAEQALRQLAESIGKETVDWLIPTKSPPLSPIINGLDGTLEVAATLSFPFNIDPPAYSPELPPRPASTAGMPDVPPSHQRPQLTQTPSSNLETSDASGHSKKRKRRRKNHWDGPGETVDSINGTPSATPVGSRPGKRQKLMEESPSSGPATERERSRARSEPQAMMKEAEEEEDGQREERGSRSRDRSQSDAPRA